MYVSLGQLQNSLQSSLKSLKQLRKSFFEAGSLRKEGRQSHEEEHRAGGTDFEII